MNTVKLNDDVQMKPGVSREGVPADAIGSVIRIYDDVLTDYGDPKTHLVRFDFDGDLDRELHWFAPAELVVIGRTALPVRDDMRHIQRRNGTDRRED